MSEQWVKNIGERDVQLASFSNRTDGTGEDTTRSVLLE